MLVTGNTGFKGAWLTLWLLSMGSEVKGLALDPPSKPSLWSLANIGDDVEHNKVDVRDSESVDSIIRKVRPEVVFHMAAQPFVRRSFLEPRETLATNVLGTANVLDAARHVDGLRVLINVTSDKCYENREKVQGYHEDEPMGGFDPYSVSKGCSELVTTAYRRSFFTSSDSPRIASARAGNVIGGGDWGEDRLVPDFMRGALSRQVCVVRRPDAIRPWQHVINPLGGYLILAQAAWNSQEYATAFNFGPPNGEARSVKSIVERLIELWPEQLQVRIDPGPHPHEATLLKLDSTRSYNRLGWRHTCTLDRALETIVEWHLAHQKGENMKAVTLAQIEALSE